MPLPNQNLREIILNILFSKTFSNKISSEMISLLMVCFKTTKKNIYLALKKAEEIQDQKVRIDQLISQHCQEYSLERITQIEKAALQIGIYELLIEKKEPAKVCINEAIRITKKFSSLQSAKFVNAVLDEAYKNEPSH